MNREKKFLIGGCLSITVLLILMTLLCDNALNSFVSTVCTAEVYYLIVFIFILNIFCAINSKQFFCVFISVAILFFSWFSLVDNSYSMIDELLHFENINHIVRYHSLATFDSPIDASYLNIANEIPFMVNGPNYEAVQAPLYYILFAIVSFIIESAYIRLHVLRLISLFSVLLIFFYIEKIKKYLYKIGIIKENEQTYRLMLLLTIFSPGYLYRASRLSNEMLVCVLMIFLLYFSIKCWCEGYQKKYYWILSFVCVALFLTKSTAVYAYVVFGVVVLLQKRIKEAVVPTIVGALSTIPWFVFNIKEYGSLTAMKEHLDFVIPIVNPTKANIDLFEAFFYFLPTSFYSGEELSYSVGEVTWISILIIFVLGLLVYVFSNIVCMVSQTIKEKRVLVNNKDFLNVICIALILAGIACLVVGTISTHINSVRGRYFYGPCIALIFLVLLNIEEIGKKGKLYLGIVCSITLAIVFSRGMITCVSNYFAIESLYASEVSEFKLLDLTDENWKHGISIDGKMLLVENDGKEYQVLIGRPVIIDEQNAIIQNVQEHGEYIHIELNKSINTELVDSNIVFLENEYIRQAYNVSNIASIIGNIEGQEVVQELVIKDTGIINGFEVMLGNYGDLDYDADVIYNIVDGDGHVLVIGETKLDNIADNSYVQIYLEDSLKVNKNQTLQLVFTIDNGQDKPLAIYTSQNDAYVDGELFINEIEQLNQDICIVVLTN